MRRWRGSSRGLAEIVGTLMLVVIVVAAATAFSFFVASYQKQVQASETATHDRELEKVKIVALTTGGCSGSACAEPLPPNGFGQLDVLVASLDPNPIAVTGISINGHSVLNYSVTVGTRTVTPCFAFNNTTETRSTSACRPYGIPAFSETNFVFNFDNSTGFDGPSGKCYSSPGELDLSSCMYAFGLPYASPLLSASHSVQFDIVTSYGNDFVSSFIPPIPVIDLTYVNDYPILDGANSYQPSGGTTANSSISTWQWTVQQVDGRYHGSMTFYGQSVQLTNPFAPGASYWINLTVTNSFGLTGATSEFYVASGVLSSVTVTFASNFSGPGLWWVVFGAVNESSSSPTIEFLSVPNGTFSFTVGPVVPPPDPDAGSVWLDGKAATVNIKFG